MRSKQDHRVKRTSSYISHASASVFDSYHFAKREKLKKKMEFQFERDPIIRLDNQFEWNFFGEKAIKLCSSFILYCFHSTIK